jgi:hypothetical protein
VDSDDAPQWDSYRVLITRDGSGWRATLDGPGLPGHGRYMTGKTIANLEARAHELFDDLPDRSCWHLEYENPASPAALHDWYMTGLDLGRANRQHAKHAHALASALAADGATIHDIAAATSTSYLCAAWMLATEPQPTRLIAFAGSRREDRRYYRSCVVSLLRVIAADKVRRLISR